MVIVDECHHISAERPFEHLLILRSTHFRIPECEEQKKREIHEIYTALTENVERNELIISDIQRCIQKGCSPIVLTKRTTHVEYLASQLEKLIKNVIVLKGGMGKKQRQALHDRVASIPEEEERVILATGRYVGEGFDDARLDTLLLTMPISWKGTLQQYAGRLHRLHEHKKEVQIYDYVDHEEVVLKRMYEKRLKGYMAMGYMIKE